jgi:hypothetical protein
MEAVIALWIVFFISIAGVIFSGVLTYKEMSASSCDINLKKGKNKAKESQECGSCGIKIFGLPTCLYGFVMYLIVLIICIVALFF